MSEAAARQASLVAPSGAAGSMAQGPDSRGDKPVKRSLSQPPRPRGGVDQAFELWLNRGLHQLYDAVAQEPVPDELLKLIEQDKAGHKQ